MLELKDLKTLRLVKILSSIKYLYKLQGNKVFYKKYAIKKKVWQDISYKAIKSHDQNLPWLDVQVSNEAIINHPNFLSFDSKVQEQLLQWQSLGYMSLPNFFSDSEVDEAESSILEGASEKAKNEYYANRLLNLYRSNKAIDRIFKNSELLRILSFLLGKEIAPYQTTNFYRSASQAAHSDSIHLTTEPLGYLIGVWVALEDIIPGSGEFYFYPGSHKLKYLVNDDYKESSSLFVSDKQLNKKYEEKVADVIDELQLTSESYLPKKGDIMIWHANLLHGSLPKVDLSLTRKSLIMHYFAKGVLCYHEMMEKPAVFLSK